MRSIPTSGSQGGQVFRMQIRPAPSRPPSTQTKTQDEELFGATLRGEACPDRRRAVRSWTCIARACPGRHSGRPVRGRIQQVANRCRYLLRVGPTTGSRPNRIGRRVVESHVKTPRSHESAQMAPPVQTISCQNRVTHDSSRRHRLPLR